MMLPVVLRRLASEDVTDIFHYLERQQVGLGQDFLNQFKETLERIGALPNLYGIVWRHVRAARIRRFTYVAYYRVLKDRVEILAILHGSRDLSIMKNRI